MSWKLLEEGWVICNTDGASKRNSGYNAYGFCVRDCEGHLIYTEAQNIGITTNMEAKSFCYMKGLQFCFKHNIHQLKLETDSLSLKNMISRDWKIPWELAERLEEIQKIINLMNVQVKHIFREANQLADFNANTTTDKEDKQQYEHYSQLPSMGRRLVNIDKQQIPSIRVKTNKINNCYND